MSRKDVEELLKQLQEAGKEGGDHVSLDRRLFTQALDGLERLEQALDNRPSLIKKLNEKIIKLECELEILRNETRVNELEKKVQRLEGELQRSYATKNFTLKNGLLEIEKAYRDFITGSPAVQSLWDEITLLLVEDKESLPQHILARRIQHAPRLTEVAGGDTASEAAAASVGSPLTPPSQGGDPRVTSLGGDLTPSVSYVQQQVDKFKDYNFTPGHMDPHDTPASLHPPHYHPHAASTHGGAADARYEEAADEEDRPTGQDGAVDLAALREQYDDGQPVAPSTAGGLPAVVSPLRPVSLFGAGSEANNDAVPDPSSNPDPTAPDTAALESCRQELSASLDQLRTLFAQYDWAPTAPHLLHPGMLAAAATTPLAAAGAEGREAEAASAGLGSAGTSPAAGAAVRSPDAGAFRHMAASLEVSVGRLREYFSKMRWAPGTEGGSTSGGGNGSRPGQSPAPGIGASSGLAPDARYFDSQAEAILASVQQLRAQFQEAAEAAAAADFAAASGGGGPDVGDKMATDAAACVVPDARYFETQADAITASLDELVRLYERSSGGGVDMLTAGGGGLRGGPWPALATGSSGLQGEGAAVAGSVVPDARAGEAGPSEAEGSASVAPLVDLFSSFLAHLQATRPGLGLGGVAAGAAAAGSSSSCGIGLDGTEQEQQQQQYNELVRMFTQYARAWSGSAAPVAATAAAAATIPPSTQRGADAAAAAEAAAPLVRFRIAFDSAGDGGGVTTHLSVTSSAPAAAADGVAATFSARTLPPPPLLLPSTPSAFAAAADEADVAAAAPPRFLLPTPISSARPTDLAQFSVAATSAAVRSPSPLATSAAAAATPMEVLLASLESRHGRRLAASPEAVAVWRDMLRLLGVDPDSRTLPAAASPGAGTTPEAAPPSGSRSGSRKSRRSRRSGAAVVAAAAQGAAAGGSATSTPAMMTPVASASHLMQRAQEGTEVAADADAAAAAAATTAMEAAAYDMEDAAAEATGRDETAAVSAAGSPDDFHAASSAGNGLGARGASAPDEVGDVTPYDTAAASPSAAAMAEAAVAAMASYGEGGGSRSPPRTLEARSLGLGEDDEAAGGVAAETADERDVQQGPSAAGTNPAAAASQGTSSNADFAAQKEGEDIMSGREGLNGADEDEEGDSESGSSFDSAEEAEAEAGAAARPGSGGGFGAVEADEVGTPASASSEDGTLGLVAGGVRFQVSLSEITPAHAVSSPAQPVLVQFRARVDDAAQEGAPAPAFASAAREDAATAATMTAGQGAAELAQVQQVRSELASTQELVLHLNRQLKRALEGREDMVARAERLGFELAATQATAEASRLEGNILLRQLVDAKVQLAEVQSEYMQVYGALKRALGTEKDMMARIDELERVLAVVSPGDVSYEEGYGSAIGRASSLARAADMLAGLPAAGPGPGRGQPGQGYSTPGKWQGQGQGLHYYGSSAGGGSGDVASVRGAGAAAAAGSGGGAWGGTRRSLSSGDGNGASAGGLRGVAEE